MQSLPNDQKLVILSFKNQTNKHTPIEIAVQKLRDVVIEMARKHEDTINRQRRNAPLLVVDKLLFKNIKQKITHEALHLILRECISAGKLVEDLAHSNKRLPDIQRNTCKKGICASNSIPTTLQNAFCIIA